MRIYALRPSLTSPDTITTDLLRILKPHTTPVLVLAVDQTSTLLATGAADGVVKVWDIRGGYTTHTFRGPNILVSALHFFELAANAREEVTGISVRNRRRKSDAGEEDEVTRSFRLASGSQDGKVRIYDLFKRTCTATLDSHVSDVRALSYSTDENALMTASRDKTLMWWDARTWKVRKVAPVLEEIEAAGFLTDGTLTYTAGVNGRIRLWRTDTAQEVTRPQAPGAEGEGIVDAIYFKDLPFILTVNADHIIILHSVEGLDACTTGTHDEIIDLAYLTLDKSLLALATNSEEIRIVSLAQDESTYFGADVAQLKGHDDIIICLDIDWSGHWIATGAKDNTARLWRIDPANNSFACYATFTGHAESLGAVSLPKITPPVDSPAFKDPLSHPPTFLLTGSQDQTIKKWDVPTKDKKARALYTRKAHEKDINAIDISNNGQLFASASQDKTVKIWDVEEGETIGILRGHRRGVWSVKFAPKDTPIVIGENGPAAGKGLILTGSGDKTLKIWSLSDYSCLRTFEGHTNSVLKVAWLNPDKKHVQIASAGGDGLVKVWDASTGEVECTLDNHEDRVWALAIGPNNTIVSGSGDSTVSFWKDTTSTTIAAASAAATQFVEQEQELQNYIHAGSYREAITLALQLNHPGKLLSLFTAVVQNNEGLSGLLAVDYVLANLSDEQLYTLLLRLRDWNTNARTAPIAQRIFWALVKSYPASKFVNLKGKSLKEVVAALKAYTERHYRRMEELVDESYLVEYTLREMDEVTFGVEEQDVVMV
jgi:U3 small nucleolar RNA-associated protein 13